MLPGLQSDASCPYRRRSSAVSIAAIRLALVKSGITCIRITCIKVHKPCHRILCHDIDRLRIAAESGFSGDVNKVYVQRKVKYVGVLIGRSLEMM
jgi:hypothetical protein